MEELEYVQRNLIKMLTSETEKEEEKQDKTIINQLSKTIAEIFKVLARFWYGSAGVITYKRCNICELF